MAPGAPRTPNVRIGSRVATIVAATVAAYFVLVALGHFLSVHGHPEYGPPIDAAAVGLIGVLIAVLLGGAIRAYMIRSGQTAHISAVRLVVNILIALGVSAVLLSLFGVSLESLLVSSAFAGIVIGLAAQTVLSNVLAGLLLAVASPFQEGDRISLVNTGSYSVFSSTYAHETYLPTYTGVIRTIGLIYTEMRLDSGLPARVPNQAMLASLIIRQSHPVARRYRVRMTFDLKVPVATLEQAVADFIAAHPAVPGFPEPHVEVADVGVATWDGVVVVWSNEGTEEPVRDAVMRSVLPRLARAPTK